MKKFIVFTLIVLMLSSFASAALLEDIWEANYADSDISHLNADTGYSRTDYSSLSGNHMLVVNGDTGDVWAVRYTANMITLYEAGAGYAKTEFAALTNPLMVALDGEGDPWVINRGSNMVSHYNISDAYTRTDYATGLAPTGVTVDLNGDVWVVNSGDDDVRHYDRSGGWSTTDYAIGNGANGIAIDSLNNVWVANTDDDDVSLLEAASAYAKTDYTVGNDPRSVVIDSNDNVWVSNKLDSDVSRLEKASAYARTDFAVGSNPVGISVDENDNIISSNYNDNDVSLLNASDAYSRTDYATGTGPWNIGSDMTGQRWFAKFGGASPPPSSTLNISESLPANNSQFNTLLLNLNLTANASLTFDVKLFINGVLNQTAQYGSGTDVFVDFDLAFLNTTEETFTYYFSLNTTSDQKNTTVKTFHIDNVFPQITWTTPNNANTTIIAYTLLSDIFLEDPNMFSYLYNITYTNGTQYHTSSNNTLTGLTNYTINDTVNFTGEEGAFYAYAEVCDGHTDENITIESIEIENVTLVVEDEGDSINVSMADEEDTESVSYIEEDNKVSFGFVSDSTTSSEQFIVESNHYIHILDGLTQYEGHLVMGKKWMDFETEDLSSVHIVRLTDYSVEVTVTKFTSTDEWDFESIGELNCRNQTRSFLVHVSTTGNNSQTLSGDVLPYLLNVTMNTSYYTTANATLYWNNTAYPATATNTSTHFFFNTSVTIPPLMNDTNVTYYWNYYLGTTEFNTSEENTTVYSPRISNCTAYPTQWVKYLIKDETFETLLNGSITFQFTYSNGAYSNNYNGLMSGNTTFPICMYPSWGNFSTNATIQYQTTEAGYTSREYQTTGFGVYESNRTVDLFLLEGATDITFHIIDDADNNLQGVTVEAYRYRIATDTDVLVETEATDAEGKVILNLASGTTFYSFKIYDTNGTLRISTARFKLFSTNYEYIIQTGRANPLASRLKLFANLEDSLTYDTVTRVINYTYNYSGGSPDQWCLTVTGNGTQWNYQCLNTSSGSFNYTITELNITYLATVQAVTADQPTVVNQLGIDTNTPLKDIFGSTNTLFIALIIFLVVSLLGLVNANIAIVLSLISIVIMSLFSLIPLSWGWLVGIIILGLAMLWVVNRR